VQFGGFWALPYSFPSPSETNYSNITAGRGNCAECDGSRANIGDSISEASKLVRHRSPPELYPNQRSDERRKCVEEGFLRSKKLETRKLETVSRRFRIASIHACRWPVIRPSRSRWESKLELTGDSETPQISVALDVLDNKSNCGWPSLETTSPSLCCFLHDYGTAYSKFSPPRSHTGLHRYFLCTKHSVRS
jgi:hypothetical protein